MSPKPWLKSKVRFSRKRWPAKLALSPKPWPKSKARFNRKRWPAKLALSPKPWPKSKVRFNRKRWPAKPASLPKPWPKSRARFSRTRWPVKLASLRKPWRKRKTLICPTPSILSARSRCRRQRLWLKRFQTRKRTSKFLTVRACLLLRRRTVSRTPLNNPLCLCRRMLSLLLNSLKKKKRKSGISRKWICPLLRKDWKKRTLRFRQNPQPNRNRMNNGGTDTPNRLRPLMKRRLTTCRNPKPLRMLIRQGKRTIRNCTVMLPREITGRILIRTKTAIRFITIRIPLIRTKMARHTISTPMERRTTWMKTAIRTMWTKTVPECILNPLIRPRVRRMRMKTAIRTILMQTVRHIIWMPAAHRIIWMKTERHITLTRTACRIIWMKTERHIILTPTGFLIM